MKNKRDREVLREWTRESRAKRMGVEVVLDQ